MFVDFLGIFLKKNLDSFLWILYSVSKLALIKKSGSSKQQDFLLYCFPSNVIFKYCCMIIQIIFSGITSCLVSSSAFLPSSLPKSYRHLMCSLLTKSCHASSFTSISANSAANPVGDGLDTNISGLPNLEEIFQC